MLDFLQYMSAKFEFGVFLSRDAMLAENMETLKMQDWKRQKP